MIRMSAELKIVSASVRWNLPRGSRPTHCPVCGEAYVLLDCDGYDGPDIWRAMTACNEAKQGLCMATEYGEHHEDGPSECFGMCLRADKTVTPVTP